jgi:uncharacterized protein
MGMKKQRKARRRVEKSMEQAWNALDNGDFGLAQKWSQRAVDEGRMNPRIWNDHGLILQFCQREEDAVEAFRSAIVLAPTYADALSNLAKLLMRLGQVAQAVRLQTRLAELEPMNTDAQETLRNFQALLLADVSPAVAVKKAVTISTERTSRFDWRAVEDDLTRNGCARLSGLLSEAECSDLVALYGVDSNFEHTVHCDDGRGKLTYRFLKSPLSELVTRVRAELYCRAAVIANRWQELLGRSVRFPAELVDYLEQCAQAGQCRSTPILIKYLAGGFNALHQDISGKMSFPLQLVVTLGPSCSENGGGGEFLLVDQGPGKKSVTHTPTAVGDAILFCTSHRLAKVGGIYGLQAVQHGLSTVLHGERYAAGIPFHDYAGASE